MPDDTRDPLFCLRLDAEDRAILDAVAEADRLTKADVIRRAVRARALELGLKLPKSKPKKK